MTSAAAARKLALALPEAVEQDHHGFPSFRVAKKIFATMPDEEHMNVMLAADHVDGAIATSPDACEELWWGKSLSGVRVTLAAIDGDALGALLRQAWTRRAPRSLRDD